MKRPPAQVCLVLSLYANILPPGTFLAVALRFRQSDDFNHQILHRFYPEIRWYAAILVHFIAFTLIYSPLSRHYCNKIAVVTSFTTAFGLGDWN
jgi:hypothetical protein